MRRIVKIRMSLLTLTLVLATLLGIPTTAQASVTAGCSGSRIEHITNIGSPSVGTLDVYYSTANGGTNCAILYSNHTGYTKFMQVKIYRCTGAAGSYCGSAVPSSYDQVGSDPGYYYSYAGPVSVIATASRCIAWAGQVDDPPTQYVPGGNVAKHC